MSRYKEVTIQCVDCGCDVCTTSNKRKYCGDCKKARDKEAVKTAHKKYKYREVKSRWRKNNPHKHTATQSLRRARKLNQTPGDADLELIEEIYLAARMAQMYTGLPIHVDHIKPLSKGGLHHQDNLQLLYATDNWSKGASWEDN